MSETTIINGQPQRLGNRMVTHDGLVDFLKMLKNEIPRMGVNNTHLDSEYVYSEGIGNSINTAKYGKVIGCSNTVYSQNQEEGFQNFFIVGSNNNISSDGKNIFIFGADNTGNGSNLLLIGEANKADWNCISAYGFGNHLTLTSNSVWLGSYNNPKSDVVFGIGNGTSEQPSNLFEITNNGVIKLGTVSISKSELIMPEGKISAKEAITNQFTVTDSDTYSAIKMGPISVDLSEAIETGVGLMNYSFYRDENGGYTNPINDQDAPILLNGGLRPIFRPWGDNQMLWVTNIHKDNKDTLHINYTDQTTLNESYNPHWHIPSTIHFHAGGQNTWANIKCGEVRATKYYMRGCWDELDGQTLQSGSSYPFSVTGEGLYLIFGTWSVQGNECDFKDLVYLDQDSSYSVGLSPYGTLVFEYDTQSKRIQARPTVHNQGVNGTAMYVDCTIYALMYYTFEK